MIIEIIVLGLLLGWVLGGKITQLADAKIQHVWLIFVAVALYWIAFAAMYVKAPMWVHGIISTGMPLTYVVLATINHRIPGVKFILIGLVANTIAISANSGMMPGSKTAIAAVYGQEFLKKAMSHQHVRHCFIDASTRFSFLCDIIPAHRPFVLFRSVYSIGDVIMSLGLMIAIITLMKACSPKDKTASNES